MSNILKDSFDASDYSDSDDSLDEEYSRKNYESNIYPSGIKLLIGDLQFYGVREQQLRSWLHTLRVVNVAEDIYDDICHYVSNSQEHGYGLKIHYILRIERANEHEFSPKDRRRRMLLWHGTQTQYVPLILQHGFKPPPAKGQMFGAGIYFADRASKSANYCDPNLKPTIGTFGYMFLCDVIIGEYYNAKNAKNTYTTAPTITTKSGQKKVFDSVKCTGKKIPDAGEEIRLGKCVLPLGKTVGNSKYPNCTLIHNEFIVYAAEQVKPKYLLSVEFVPNKVIY